ncbi:phosphomannomutase [Agromyces luteolus]|uniref:Phospho-sugar mutase n=1 Tax=Agromyces luteolus TaxID=88373 RepID=A0A7C9HZ18_9MICO|nr:phospho-sugar mutase [Agromyces luteolus]MUN07060.1 phospho-sugar mutase [Agromyces luteolus]GLK28332.1 phosphomannomutase [Agromyces luteolus]
MPELTDADRIARAEAWIAQDPDPETREELAAIVARVREGDAAASADLADRFDARLAFGTAGLRGEIAAGPNRMNRVLVSQGAAGLAAHLVETSTDAAAPSVVVGYDGRRNSEAFARDVAEVMAGAGLRAILLPRLLPTPVLAFAVRHLGTSAGVMITASHNPPNDNGMKVYLGGADQGSQIVAPADAEIAAQIDRVAATVPVTELPRGAFETAGESVVDAYVDATAAVASAPAAQPRVVYTAMHGVGWETMRRVLEAAGFDAPSLVAEQIEPDGRFPTVSFPNPEEPGAMDLSFAAARAAGADLVIANDPDADRLAVAIPDAADPEGYRRLTGNEVGLLLGWQVAEAAAGSHGTLACSIVSSPGLEAVARAHGLDFRATLTGFKWISRAPDLVFGFEEALGYLVNPGTVRDKDGISAAIAFLSLAARLAAEGRTIADHLDDFALRFGRFDSSQVSIRVTDLSRIADVMARLRAEPPSEVGGIAVERIDDLAVGVDGHPPSDVLRLVFEGGARVMVRPSGTEPKLKVYIDAVATDGSLEERRVAASDAVARLEAGMRALVS